MADPKFIYIETNKGKVFKGPTAEQDFRNYLDEKNFGILGAPLGPVIEAYRRQGDIKRTEFAPTDPIPTPTEPKANNQKPTEDASRSDSALSMVKPLYEGISGAVSSAGETVSSFLKTPAKELPGALGQLVADTVKTGALAIPGQVAQLVGIDPEKVKLAPFIVPGFGMMGMPRVVEGQELERVVTKKGKVFEGPNADKDFRDYLESEGFGVGDTPISSVIKAYQKQGDITSVKFKDSTFKPATLKSIGASSDTPAGEIASVLGPAIQMYYTRGALAKGGSGAIASLVSKLPPSVANTPFVSKFIIPTLEYAQKGGTATRAPLDYALNALQSFSLTGDKSRALEDAFWGSVIGEGITGTARVVAAAARPLSTYFAKKALKMIDGFNQSDKGAIEYHQKATTRLQDTESTFDSVGVEKNDKRFMETVGSMKNASTDADILNSELIKRKLIPEDAAQMVDYRAPLDEAFLALKKEQVSQSFRNRLDSIRADIEVTLPKELKLDASGKPIPVNAKDAFGKSVPVLAKDASGNPISTGRQQPVFELDQSGKPVIEKARDAQGNLLIGDYSPEGNPIYVNKTDPVTGKPIYKQAVDPSGQKKFETIYEQAKDVNGNLIFKQAEDVLGDPVFQNTGKPRNLTFTEAEQWKEKFNKVLKKWYESKLLDPEKTVDKAVKNIFADSLRKAQQTGFDDARKTFQAVEASIPNDPAGKAVKSMNPWDVYVPGVNRPLTYREAGFVAKMDADISQAGWGARRASEAQAATSTFNPMATAIATAQAIHGSPFTPSQMATGFRSLTNPRFAPTVSKFLGSIASPSPFQATIPPTVRGVPIPIIGGRKILSVERSSVPVMASKGYIADKTAQPPEQGVTTLPSMQSLLEQKNVRVVPKPSPAKAQQDYFKRTY